MKNINSGANITVNTGSDVHLYLLLPSITLQKNFGKIIYCLCLMIQPPSQTRGLREIEFLSKLMDSKFRVPGTDIRFGLDSIIGLIPVAGDLSTFAISGYMVIILARNGASGFLLARMILNILIDALVGMIPFLGDLFDVAFKANMRNLRLMQEHYVEGRHRGSAWKLIIPVLIVLFLVVGGIMWLGYKLLSGLF